MVDPSHPESTLPPQALGECWDELRSPSLLATRKVREWLKRVEVKTLYIEPGSSWENGNIESFDGKLRYELLDR